MLELWIFLFGVVSGNFIDAGGAVTCTGINSCVGIGDSKAKAVGNITCTGSNSCQSIEMHSESKIDCTGASTCVNVPKFVAADSIKCIGDNSCVKDSSLGIEPAVLADTDTLKTNVATLQTEMASLPSLTGFNTDYNSPVFYKDVSKHILNTLRNTQFYQTVPLELYNVD